MVLSFLIPGIGHLYLREWVRSVFWFLTVVLVGNLLIPPSAASGEFSLQAVSDMFEAAPLVAKLTLVGLTALCMADAYWVAKREQPLRQRGDSDQTCPNCGKDVDADLDFCHWCSADLSPENEPDDTLTAGEVHDRSGALDGDLTGGPDPDDDGDEED
ncbi:MAG: zinc ribbon domain-containing protein [Haloarculaceae archaeon]